MDIYLNKENWWKTGELCLFEDNNIVRFISALIENTEEDLVPLFEAQANSLGLSAQEIIKLFKPELPPNIKDYIQLNKYFRRDEVLYEDINKIVNNWLQAFPGLDILGELRKMNSWLEAHPHKHYRDWRKFISGWLARSYDRMPKLKSGELFNRDFKHGLQDYE